MNLLKFPTLTATLLFSLPLAASEQEETGGFFADSHLNLLLRNAYFDRNFKDNGTDRSRWGQGFITTFESGFTQGMVGFGIDAFVLAAVKLDTGESRNDGDITFFPTNSSGDPENSISEAGLALKLRISNTTLKHGNQLPAMPVLSYDSARLLPQTFTGTLLVSQEIDQLTFNVGRFTAQNEMVQTGRDSGGLKSIDLAGISYEFSENLSAEVYISDIKDTAEKQYLNLHYIQPLSETSSLDLDFNLYHTQYDTQYTGTGREERNTIWSLQGTYNTGAHTFILAHQRSRDGFVSADDDGNMVAHGYDFDIGDGGNSNYLANAYYSDYNAKDERSWQLSYELDFETYGVPGLSFKTAYVRGDNIDTGERDNATEREVYNQLQYIVQNGMAKDLSILVSHSFYRASNAYTEDLDELQVFVEYPIDFF